jgi:hypothetical protein
MYANIVKKSKVSLTKQSIDRTKPKTKKVVKKVVENIPPQVCRILVEDVLRNVGESDWNDPNNVFRTIADMMSIDTTKPIEDQEPVAHDIDRTVLVQSNGLDSSQKKVPFWICQSFIRIDERKGNRYVEYEGSKYNKLDILQTDYFQKRMDQVAKLARCTWNYRWGGSKNPDHKLYQKTREDGESWLDRCVGHLLGDNETGGIDIKDLVMVEFKRNLNLV